MALTRLLVGRTHRKRLRAYAEGASRIEVAVAFLGVEGVKLAAYFAERAPTDVAVSTYLGVTRKVALVGLRKLLQKGVTLRVQVLNARHEYHGKVYLFHYPDGRARLVVGSANMSAQGLLGRGDVSVMVDGAATALPLARLSDIPGSKETPWATPDALSPLDEVIAKYHESPFGEASERTRQADLHYIVGVVDLSPHEEELVEGLLKSDPAKVKADRTEGSWAGGDEDILLVRKSPGDEHKFRVLSAARVGHYLVERWKDGGLHLAVIEGVFLGVLPGDDRPALMLHVPHRAKLPLSLAAKLGAKSRSFERHELPEGLVSRLS